MSDNKIIKNKAFNKFLKGLLAMPIEELRELLKKHEDGGIAKIIKRMCEELICFEVPVEKYKSMSDYVDGKPLPENCKLGYGGDQLEAPNFKTLNLKSCENCRFVCATGNADFLGCRKYNVCESLGTTTICDGWKNND